ncbi:MAG: hypothetical protein ACKO38_02275 [Planctomycetota bacterium]
MKMFVRLVFSTVFVNTLVAALSGNAFAAGAGDPAWRGHHPLTQAEVGSLLIAELRCAACHAGVERGAVPAKNAPDLSNVGSRISPEYLRRFIAEPTKAHAGTTMPDVMAGKPAAERKEIAAALTHFLVAQSRGDFRAVSTNASDRQQGKTLFHAVGCVACHGAKEPPPESLSLTSRNDQDLDDDEPSKTTTKASVKPLANSLAHIGAKYSAGSLADFLFQPLAVRSSGRMPDMKLTPAESRAIAAHLIGDEAPTVAALVVDASLVEAGKKYFATLQCAACHSMNGTPSSPVGRLVKIDDMERGCLSRASDRSPRFELDDSQLRAITASLRQESAEDSDRAVVAKTLTAFRCVACHVRDNYGGVHDDHNPYFSGSELKLGDDGRIPPPLTLIGAKLRPEWMKKVLFDGESVRQYMATRMPQYGSANLSHLPALLSRIDVLEGRELKIPSPESRVPSEREREKLLRPAGRELLGDKGLNCVACHHFNGKASTGNQGIDLLTSYPRLQSAWFNAYVRNPGAFRLRTVMPTAWPDGIATHKTILDGNTDQQIEAIWYYLSLGTSAADPSGIRDVGTKIVVDDTAKIHRGRSRVAGYRGIAVGLPGRLNYAFNAETGTLSAIWQGDFVSVNWSGQGSGNFNPATDPVSLAQDVSFALLVDEKEPWPLLPVMTQEARTNPNPLYPKNVGYQFLGYHLGESEIPTFQYRSGSIEIEDRSTVVEREGKQHLKRELRFHSPSPQTVWFRCVAGEITRESERVFRSGRLRLTVPAADLRLRSSNDDPKRSELLLRLTLPQGDTSLELLYEPLAR